ncbi:hypothetical protein ACFOGI_05970 [Virgibacillus xinjiangensis]|uniref:Uncharacterized protein n=1 Tax=Virgibacillus xinjiangensis TaxID=393090 RepID=A0ABV7CTX0_9BACI
MAEDEQRLPYAAEKRENFYKKPAPSMADEDRRQSRKRNEGDGISTKRPQ